MSYEGLLLGLGAFLCIGIFHPLVIKAEYYWGIRSWWMFLIIGLAGTCGSLLVSNIYLSIFLGIFAFSAFWGIGEVIKQEKRVLRGWFPENPKRHAYYERRRKELKVFPDNFHYPKML
ncbi:MAG: DUF4491 family protein [Paludibacteraceae bacterium]|nr:DUF4491 family protein [Paludibacteraceae bacterium]